MTEDCCCVIFTNLLVYGFFSLFWWPMDACGRGKKGEAPKEEDTRMWAWIFDDFSIARSLFSPFFSLNQYFSWFIPAKETARKNAVVKSATCRWQIVRQNFLQNGHHVVRRAPLRKKTKLLESRTGPDPQLPPRSVGVLLKSPGVRTRKEED